MVILKSKIKKNKMNRTHVNIIKWYAIIIGTIIILTWVLILLNNNDFQEGIKELTFHLISEFIMAFTCITGGVLIHRKKITGCFIVFIGFGMLIYSTLNAGGYYLELGDYVMPFLMLFLFLTTVFLTFLLIEILSYENK